MTDISAVEPPQTRPFAYEVSPHAPYSSAEPLKGISVANASSTGLTYFVAAQASPDPALPYEGVTASRVRLPFVDGAFLEATGWRAGHWPDLTCRILIDLGQTTMVSKIGLIGDLMHTPIWTAHGPEVNFLLPRRLGVWALKSLYDPSDQWIECRAPGPLFALWGWTPVPFAAVNARYLMIQCSDLPLLNSMGVGPITALTISRLAVYPYTELARDSEFVDYSPVSCFATQFDAADAYWATKGVPAPQTTIHQSIYRDTGPDSQHVTFANGVFTNAAGMDLLPSALVDMPLEYPDWAELQWKASPNFSTSTTQGNTDYALTLALIEGPATPVRGVALMEPWPRRVENQGAPIDIGAVDVYATQSDEAAFSSDFGHTGWERVAQTRVQVLMFADAAVPYFAYRILFESGVNAKYLRLVFRTLPNYNAQRRIELSYLRVLRDKNFMLLPFKGRDLISREIRLLLVGPQLLDDFALTNGPERLDLRVEASIGGRPWLPLFHVRSLLELRELARCQVFGNSRRAKTTQFWEETEYVGEDKTSTQSTSSSNVYQGNLSNSFSKTHQGLDHRGGEVEVERWFPGDDAGDAFVNRPWTQTQGVGFIGSISHSFQINGGKTGSSTRGNQLTTEARSGVEFSSAMAVQVNSVGNPALTYAEAQTSSNQGRLVKRDEFDMQMYQDIVRGREVFFEGQCTDIVVASLSVKLRLRGDYDGRGGMDLLRLNVRHLPAGVSARCTFKGFAVTPEVDHGT